MVRFVLSLAVMSMLLASCGGVVHPTGDCSIVESFALRTGNWWVYSCEESVDDGVHDDVRVATYRDSIVVMGTAILGGRLCHEVQRFRDGVILDTMHMIADDTKLIMHGTTFTKLPCSCFDVVWLVSGVCGEQEDGIDRMQTDDPNFLPALDSNGNVVYVHMHHDFVARRHNADTTVAIAGTMVQGRKYAVRTIDSVSIAGPVNLTFADGKQFLTTTFTHDFVVAPGKGIIVWNELEMAMTGILDIVPFKSRRRIRSLVASSIR